MTDSTRRIVEQVLAVPSGKVSCYRDIGFRAGLPNGARQVSRVLHSLSHKHDLPWHRIVRHDGKIALREGEGRELQISLLRDEGVEVSDSAQVDMRRYGV
ncbi:MAG: MGMT family protein [Treponema sp.]|jgi:methylated-DNA-protein-cysteine methyltransferase-like protein|nr:MGMT family protein [Treponema sp.]